MLTDLIIRPGVRDDAEAIRALYSEVAIRSGGLARQPAEITAAYIDGFVERSLADGLLLVAELPALAGLAGELHAYRNGLARFSHVLGALTVAVHPDAQGRGVGRRLFQALIAQVRTQRLEIHRIELITQESNAPAIGLYESLGFQREGRLEQGIRSAAGGLEADIPMGWLRSRGMKT